jgi:hypothetical protein
MPSNPHAFYSSFAEELLAKFRRVGHLVSHRTTTGNYHEEILRVVLRNFLSKRYSVKTGFAFKSEQEVSRQVDILIVDENDAAAYLFQEGDFAIVRARSVAAAIEVKTHLGKREFIDSVKNIVAVCKLADPPNKIFGAIFGYASPRIGNEKPLDGWFKDEKLSELSENPALGPELTVFLQRRFLLVQTSDRLQMTDGGRFRLLAHFTAATGRVSRKPRLAPRGNAFGHSGGMPGARGERWRETP